MSPIPDDLTLLKDDMIAFIEGHGMRRFSAYVNAEEVQCVTWKTGNNPDSWKDFVELAKAADSSFLTMDSWVLEPPDLDDLAQRLGNAQYSNEEDVEEARWLRTHLGKTGFIQLGWAYQGSMFLYEVATGWYENYQRLVDLAEDFGSIALDESDPDDEH